MRTERGRRAAASALVAVLALGGLAQTRPAGAHEIVRQWWLTAKDGANAGLRVVFERRDADGSTRIDDSTGTVPYAALRGLTAADVAAPVAQTHRFEIVEDPGTFTFQGVVGNGGGKGSYDFVTDPAFQRALARRGVRAASDLEAIELALRHFKTSSLDDVLASGVQNVTPADLVLMNDHGMTLDFVRSFKSVALAPKTMSALAQLRDHGVRPSLVQALSRSSYRDVSATEITELADHGVSPDYITGLDRIGYHPAAADIVRLRDHGVSTAFIQRLRTHGYGSMSVADIIKLYEHGI